MSPKKLWLVEEGSLCAAHGMSKYTTEHAVVLMPKHRGLFVGKILIKKNTPVAPPLPGGASHYP